jgi:hypothetical protein
MPGTQPSGELHTPVEHPLAGAVAVTASQALGYEHPVIGVGAGVLSALSAHPFMLLTPVAVMLGGGNVDTLPVGVYIGNWATFTLICDILAGGHGSATVAVGLMEPAPAPPVCHGRYVPSNGLEPAPREAHLPTAVRGSFGIQPFSSPSLYDHNGASTFPAAEFPT